jgi:dihydroneopterin aldolase
MTGYQSKRASARDKLSDTELFDQVIDQLRSDIEWRDFTAIEELLKFVPRKNLIAFLKEDV